MRRHPFWDRIGVEHPIIQAPMAGAMDADLVTAAGEGGALGSLPCAMLGPEQVRSEVARIRSRSNRGFNLNFFCHASPRKDESRETAWRARLAPYYEEFGIDPAVQPPAGGRAPFDAAFCDLVTELKPAVASFHFGLPDAALVARVREAGSLVLSSATTVEEARWLEARGADAIIAQGLEAGGHRGMFLTNDVNAQIGTFALVPQIVDAVKLPVIAAGGIADARGIAAALALGAAGVQIGTAYLLCPEAKISAPHRAALASGRADGTALTNLITGRPARGYYNRVMRELGPIGEAPAFPLATGALAPLRAAAEKQGSGDFSPLWSGQAAALGRALPAKDLARSLMEETQALMRALAA